MSSDPVAVDILKRAREISTLSVIHIPLAGYPPDP